MARERYGNGYLGRAATRRRMRSRDRGYVGSEKALNGPAKALNGPAKRCAAPSWARSAQSWGYGKAWR
jgi:hypothetical protein